MQDSSTHRTTRAAVGWRLWTGVCAGLLMTCVALWAANWQHGRAQQKRALQTQIDTAGAAAPLDLNQFTAQPQDNYRRAFAHGKYLAGKAVVLDNRQLDGQVGRIILMPLQLDNGQNVLVQRGWIAQGAGQRASLPTIQTPAEFVRVEGVLTEHVPQFAKFGDSYPQPLPALWPNFDWAAYRAASGLADVRWVLVQINDAADGLTRRYTPPSAGIEKHLGYRLQWIAIALLAAGLTVFFGVRAIFRKASI
jgi:surfeit locus 1 family protein